MVLPAELDTRGIIQPGIGLTRFSLERVQPSPPVARFVDRFWVVSWDLRAAPSHPQHVLTHPVVNVVFAPEGAAVHGVATGITSRVLDGTGRALGVMFRPGGFRPFLDRPVSAITDRALPVGDVLGARASALARDLRAVDSAAGMAALANAFLAALVPSGTHPCEETIVIAERIATDPTARVATVARDAGLSVRQLQRRFADHVGISPKAVIRRYRLLEAAERARTGGLVDWAAVAVSLGYSDQAHLARDFAAAIGMPPGRYAGLARRVAAVSGLPKASKH